MPKANISRRTSRPKSSRAKPIPENIAFKPSLPGFFAPEALELLGMCVVANYLGPVMFPPFPKGLHASDKIDDPLPDDDGMTYPYPKDPIWPKGWGPGVASEDAARPWQRSILTSRLSNGAGVGCAMFAYNTERDAYAVAFAGTLNPGAAMQDMAALLIPAGPVKSDFLTSQETYITDFSMEPQPTIGDTDTPLPEPPEQPPLVHLGYRQAVESLAIGRVTPANLRSILINIEKDEIDLYVTGHSLGASVAQLFSAWVRAGGVPGKKINVKCYSFATPKCANMPMAANYALALANDGYSYRVDNSLDTAQQLAPTKEAPTDLINPGIATDLQSKAKPVGVYKDSPLAPLVEKISQSSTPPFPISLFCEVIQAIGASNKPANGSAPPQPPPMSQAFVGMGAEHMLAAHPPVIYNGRYYPLEYFPNRDVDNLVDIPDDTTRQWWQHWPFTYAQYLLDEIE
jgi:hypothetical protein